MCVLCNKWESAQFVKVIVRLKRNLMRRWNEVSVSSQGPYYFLFTLVPDGAVKNNAPTLCYWLLSWENSSLRNWILCHAEWGSPFLKPILVYSHKATFRTLFKEVSNIINHGMPILVYMYCLSKYNQWYATRGTYITAPTTQYSSYLLCLLVSCLP